MAMREVPLERLEGAERHALVQRDPREPRAEPPEQGARATLPQQLANHVNGAGAIARRLDAGFHHIRGRDESGSDGTGGGAGDKAVDERAEDRGRLAAMRLESILDSHVCTQARNPHAKSREAHTALARVRDAHVLQKQTMYGRSRSMVTR